RHSARASLIATGPISMQVVLASANPKKAGEIREILGHTFELIARPDHVPDVVEDADTFEGNARLKAVALVAATGLAALADDSGLVVDAIGGHPGVHSARYAGEHASDEENVIKLLDALSIHPDPVERTARFQAVVILRHPDGNETVVEGAVEGTIAGAPRGLGGFGYDPIFIPNDGDGRTFGEMQASAKHAISHRGRALAALLSTLDR
ncbi:MAG: RdgB/HAM1 family non-canonical purine NTP pyrophosphatase, partial [Aquihabitans sp.]